MATVYTRTQSLMHVETIMHNCIRGRNGGTVIEQKNRGKTYNIYKQIVDHRNARAAFGTWNGSVMIGRYLVILTPMYDEHNHICACEVNISDYAKK